MGGNAGRSSGVSDGPSVVNVRYKKRSLDMHLL